jgi:PadR family transcriptional regulator PadR
MNDVSIPPRDLVRRADADAGRLPSPPALPREFVRAALLLLLREGPAHGYELIERVFTLGVDIADPCGLYRVLRRLEEDGLVRSAWEPSTSGPRRRIYRITRDGIRELHRRARAIAGAQRHVTTFLARYREFVAVRPAACEPAAAARSG